MRTCVVVPCYNEACRLDVGIFSDFLRTAPWDLNLLFVDDGSRDQTRSILEDLVAQNRGGASLLGLPCNQGKAEAVRRGLQEALAADAELVGYWDADLATPLSTIPLFIELLEAEPAIDAVLGSRIRLLGRRVTRRAARHYLGRCFATVVSLSLRLPVYDTQCGAKMFRRTEALEQALQKPFGSRWIFDVELLGRLLDWYRRHDSKAEARALYEFPLLQWREVAGSRITPQDFLRAAREMLDLYLRELRHLPPPEPGAYSD
jgi:glycosyltransferase involved in cell wall biosynthesis